MIEAFRSIRPWCCTVVVVVVICIRGTNVTQGCLVIFSIFPPPCYGCITCCMMCCLILLACMRGNRNLPHVYHHIIAHGKVIICTNVCDVFCNLKRLGQGVIVSLDKQGGDTTHTFTYTHTHVLVVHQTFLLEFWSAVEQHNLSSHSAGSAPCV